MAVRTAFFPFQKWRHRSPSNGRSWQPNQGVQLSMAGRQYENLASPTTGWIPPKKTLPLICFIDCSTEEMPGTWPKARRQRATDTSAFRMVTL